MLELLLSGDAPLKAHLTLIDGPYPIENDASLSVHWNMAMTSEITSKSKKLNRSWHAINLFRSQMIEYRFIVSSSDND